MKNKTIVSKHPARNNPTQSLLKKRKLEQHNHLNVDSLSSNTKARKITTRMNTRNSRDNMQSAIKDLDQDNTNLPIHSELIPAQLVQQITTPIDLPPVSDEYMAHLNNEPPYLDDAAHPAHYALSRMEKLSSLALLHHEHTQFLNQLLAFEMLPSEIANTEQAVPAPQNESNEGYHTPIRLNVPALEESPGIQSDTWQQLADLLSSPPIKASDELIVPNSETAKTNQSTLEITSLEQATDDHLTVESSIPVDEQEIQPSISKKKSRKKVNFTLNTLISADNEIAKLNTMLNILQQNRAELNFFLSDPDFTHTTEVDQLMKRIAIRMTFPSSNNEYLAPLNMQPQSSSKRYNFSSTHLLGLEKSKEIELLRKENIKLMNDLHSKLESLESSSSLAHTTYNEGLQTPVRNSAPMLEESPVITNNTWQKVANLLSSPLIGSPVQKEFLGEEQAAAKSTPKKLFLNNPAISPEKEEWLAAARLICSPTPMPSFFNGLLSETTDERCTTPTFFHNNA